MKTIKISDNIKQMSNVLDYEKEIELTDKEYDVIIENILSYVHLNIEGEKSLLFTKDMDGFDLEVVVNKYPGYLIDVDGSVYLGAQELEILPVKFGFITGDFDISMNMLESLENFPNVICGILFVLDAFFKPSFEYDSNDVDWYNKFIIYSKMFTNICKIGDHIANDTTL